MADGTFRMHTLKLREQFVQPIANADLKAITRANSRGFNSGDYIRFRVVPLDGNSIDYSIVGATQRKQFEGSFFKVTFVMSGYGLKEGYATVSFEAETDPEKIKRLQFEVRKLKRVTDEQPSPLDAYAPLLESIGAAPNDGFAREKSYRPAHGVESLDETIERLSSH